MKTLDLDYYAALHLELTLADRQRGLWKEYKFWKSHDHKSAPALVNEIRREFKRLNKVRRFIKGAWPGITITAGIS